jgi:hypothetical protein
MKPKAAARAISAEPNIKEDRARYQRLLAVTFRIFKMQGANGNGEGKTKLSQCHL